MSKEYDDYLKSHIDAVRNAVDWMVENNVGDVRNLSGGLVAARLVSTRGRTTSRSSSSRNTDPTTPTSTVGGTRARSTWRGCTTSTTTPTTGSTGCS